MKYGNFYGNTRNIFLVYSIIGIVLVIILGFVAHFLFEATNKNLVVASFTPVNESVWEHIKLLVFPYLFFVLLMWLMVSNYGNNSINNFIPGITLGIFVGSIFTIFAFYTYIGALTRENNLNVDIMIFILAVILTFIVAYCVFMYPEVSYEAHLISSIGLAFYIILIVLLTYYPIEIPLLQDPITGNYGITE